MEDRVRRIDREFGLKLTEEEIRLITRQAESAEKFFLPLYEVDITGVMPMLKMDRRPGSRRKPTRRKR